MYQAVQIGNKTVEMAANAATPLYFRQIFHRDPLKTFAKIENGPEEEKVEAVELFNQMAFVMAKDAKHADMMKLNEQDYREWLADFELMDLIKASDQIANVYFSGKIQLSEAKKG